jgi:hypothetical protein
MNDMIHMMCVNQSLDEAVKCGHVRASTVHRSDDWVMMMTMIDNDDRYVMSW